MPTGMCWPFFGSGMGSLNQYFETYPPHGRTATVPSGCSQVIVPLDVMVGGAGVPLLPICIDIIIVQSYRARPGVPAASNRRPPVMRVVAVTLDGVLPVAVPNV